MKKNTNFYMIIIGLMIMVTMSLMVIIDSNATNLEASVAPSILGSSLFIVGYIKYDKNNK